MPSNLEIRLSALAESDLQEILQFTLESWGPLQRDTYASILNEALSQLSEFPWTGTRRPDLRSEFRARLAGQHVVIYSFSDTYLDVSRVVHASRSLEGLDLIFPPS